MNEKPATARTHIGLQHDLYFRSATFVPTLQFRPKSLAANVGSKDVTVERLANDNLTLLQMEHASVIVCPVSTGQN